jgi:hypothetical protein
MSRPISASVSADDGGVLPRLIGSTLFDSSLGGGVGGEFAAGSMYEFLKIVDTPKTDVRLRQCFDVAVIRLLESFANFIAPIDEKR